MSQKDIKLVVPEVAKRLYITKEWVRNLIARKETKAVKVGQWRIKPENLEDFKKIVEIIKGNEC